MEHYYTTMVSQKDKGKIGTEGRVAILSAPSNPNFPQIIVQSPGEFKGPTDEQKRSLAWTPEDIFVASVAVCFFTTFISIAENSKLKFKNIEIEAKGKLENLPQGGSMITEITENIVCIIENESDKDKAMKILDKTEKNCLIANSMKTKIIPNFKIEIAS